MKVKNSDNAFWFEGFSKGIWSWFWVLTIIRMYLVTSWRKWRIKVVLGRPFGANSSISLHNGSRAVVCVVPVKQTIRLNCDLFLKALSMALFLEPRDWLSVRSLTLLVQKEGVPWIKGSRSSLWTTYFLRSLRMSCCGMEDCISRESSRRRCNSRWYSMMRFGCSRTCSTREGPS